MTIKIPVYVNIDKIFYESLDKIKFDSLDIIYPTTNCKATYETLGNELVYEDSIDIIVKLDLKEIVSEPVTEKVLSLLLSNSSKDKDVNIISTKIKD